jgi:hypothetical protein
MNTIGTGSGAFLEGVKGARERSNFTKFSIVTRTFHVIVANGLPTSYAAQAYVQLLTATSPEANVLVVSGVEPYASQRGTDTALAILTNEMRQSALPWVAAPTGLNIASSGHPPILIRHDEENGRCLTTTATISPARALIRIAVNV